MKLTTRIFTAILILTMAWTATNAIAQEPDSLKQDSMQQQIDSLVLALNRCQAEKLRIEGRIA